MNELQKLLENAGMKPILKEYLVQPGESLVDGAGQLNVFTDTLESPPSEYEQEFASSSEWMAVENKYKVIAWDLMGEMQKSDIVLDEYDVDTIHEVWYDGSDAYGDIETALENLPEIYDAQIEACYAILEGHDGEDMMSEDGLIEHPAKEQQIMDSNMAKVVKTIIGTAHAMDKGDRKHIDNPSKDNISVSINFLLEQIITALEAQGYKINWAEHGWDD